MYGLGLYLLPTIVEGASISGNINTYFWGGLLLTLMNLFFRPLITIVTLPLNLATFGLFSFVTNVVLLYLLTVLMPQISIHAFAFHGATIFGIVIPHVYFNPFLAFIAAALTLSLLMTGMKWLAD